MSVPLVRIDLADRTHDDPPGVLTLLITIAGPEPQRVPVPVPSQENRELSGDSEFARDYVVRAMERLEGGSGK